MDRAQVGVHSRSASVASRAAGQDDCQLIWAELARSASVESCRQICGRKRWQPGLLEWRSTHPPRDTLLVSLRGWRLGELSGAAR